MPSAARERQLGGLRIGESLGIIRALTEKPGERRLA